MAEKPGVSVSFTTLSALLEVGFADKKLTLVEQLDRGVAAATLAMHRKGGKPVLTLQLRFARGSGDEVLVTPVLTLKAPADRPYTATLYVDRAGRLVQDDPAQQPLPFEPALVPKREEV